MIWRLREEDNTKTTSAVVTALTTAFSSVASDAMDAIGAILPIALPIMGAVLVAMIGIRIFKRVANK